MNDDTYLAHHGVPGQKWGIRRYQNRDGSLTPEGRKHRGYGEKTLKDGVKTVKKAVQKAKQNRQKKKEAKAKELEKAKVKAQKAEAERKAKKAIEDEENLKAYLRKHPTKIYKNRDKLKQEDVDNLITKIEWDRKVKDVKRNEYARGVEDIRNLALGINSVSSILGSSIDIYNNTAMVYNTLMESKGSNKKKLPRAKW